MKSCPIFNAASWQMFVCKICFGTARLRDSFNPKGCDHVYCTDCTVKYVESKLPGDGRILCPSPGCGGLLDQEHCRRILPRELFDKWGVSLAESAIDGSQKFYCPYADCSALLINDEDDDDSRDGCSRRRRLVRRLFPFWVNDRKAKCPCCARALCVRCRVPWHSKMGCGKYQRTKARREEKMVESLAKENKWRRCPFCKMYVSKLSGCNHIVCRCGALFCYDCGALCSANHRCW